MERKKLLAALHGLLKMHMHQAVYKQLEESSLSAEQHRDLEVENDAFLAVSTSSREMQRDAPANGVRKLEWVLEQFVKETNEVLLQLKVNSNGFRAERNTENNSETVLDLFKTAAEQTQVFLEEHEPLTDYCSSIWRVHLLPTLERTSKLNVSFQNAEFRAEWKAYHLYFLGTAAWLLSSYHTIEKINQYIIFWMKHTVGGEAWHKKVYGFAVHSLAIVSRIVKAHENAAQHYEEAVSLYQKHRDWTDDDVKGLLCQQVLTGRKLTQRRINVAEATIGPDGGRLCMNYCEVQIPKGALSGMRKFSVSTLLDETVDNEYAPISAMLGCEPPTKFKTAVNFALPTWCEIRDEDVNAQVFCWANGTKKKELLATVNLRVTEGDIAFDSKHFSSFLVMIRRVFLKKLRFKMAMKIWKNPQGNFVFVAYARDKTVEEKWKDELSVQGYGPTSAVLNLALVRYKDELSVLLTSDEGRFMFPQQGPRRFKADFISSQAHYETFAFRQDNTSDQPITFKCEVTHKGKHVAVVVWNEQINSGLGTTARLEDVFNDEIIKAFSKADIWRQFALSSSGLGLDSYEVDEISENFSGSLERQKMEMLERWRTKAGRTDSDKISEIRQILENFRRKLRGSGSDN